MFLGMRGQEAAEEVRGGNGGNGGGGGGGSGCSSVMGVITQTRRSYGRVKNKKKKNGGKFMIFWTSLTTIHYLHIFSTTVCSSLFQLSFLTRFTLNSELRNQVNMNFSFPSQGQGIS